MIQTDRGPPQNTIAVAAAASTAQQRQAMAAAATGSDSGRNDEKKKSEALARAKQWRDEQGLSKSLVAKATQVKSIPTKSPAKMSPDPKHMPSMAIKAVGANDVHTVQYRKTSRDKDQVKARAKTLATTHQSMQEWISQ